VHDLRRAEEVLDPGDGYTVIQADVLGFLPCFYFSACGIQCKRDGVFLFISFFHFRSFSPVPGVDRLFRVRAIIGEGKTTPNRGILQQEAKKIKNTDVRHPLIAIPTCRYESVGYSSRAIVHTVEILPRRSWLPRRFAAHAEYSTMRSGLCLPILSEHLIDHTD
jgi:hypothetical protein